MQGQVCGEHTTVYVDEEDEEDSWDDHLCERVAFCLCCVSAVIVCVIVIIDFFC